MIEYLIVWKHKDSGEWHVESHPDEETAKAMLATIVSFGHKAAGVTFHHATSLDIMQA